MHLYMKVQLQFYSACTFYIIGEMNNRSMTFHWSFSITQFFNIFMHTGIFSFDQSTRKWAYLFSDADSLFCPALTLWMLGNFLKIDYIVVCFLKPINSTWFLLGNDGLSSKQVGSQASRRVTRQLAWIQPVCISINAVPALKGLSSHYLKYCQSVL